MGLIANFKVWLKEREETRLLEAREDRQFQLDVIREQLRANTRVLADLKDIVRDLSAASQAQSAAFTAWLQSFQSAKPYSSTYGDAEEAEAAILAEAERAVNAGELFDKDNMPPELAMAYALLHDQETDS